LAMRFGLAAVGYYLSIAAALTIVGLVAVPETRDSDFNREAGNVHQA